jgi:methylglyoxal synthase
MRTTVALIAHDEKKDDLVRLARAHRDTLGRLRLMATGTTGRLLEMAIGLPVERMASGPQGGDLQIGARIVEGLIDAVIFLRDPLSAHPHEPDIQALLKICDVHQVPVATNMASAEIVLSYLAEREAAMALHPAALGA